MQCCARAGELDGDGATFFQSQLRATAGARLQQLAFIKWHHGVKTVLPSCRRLDHFAYKGLFTATPAQISRRKEARRVSVEVLSGLGNFSTTSPENLVVCPEQPAEAPIRD